MSNDPATASDDQVALLQDLARLVIDELELRQIAIRDSLTGALTRRGFECDADQALQRARRYGCSLGCIALDVDRFKIVNDTYGHAVVDTCRPIVRRVDIFGRVGGEEFAIMVPDADLAGTTSTAERVRRAIADTGIPVGSSTLRITASLGVAVLADHHPDLAALLRAADDALYAAKRAGRNRVEIARR